MSHVVLNILAALSLAFGMTALTTLSVRSEKLLGLVATSFFTSLAAMIGLFLWADLPDVVIYEVLGCGLAIGGLSVVLLRFAKAMDRKAGH